MSPSDNPANLGAVGQRSRWQAGPWLRFGLACLLVAGADLWLKAWAFANLADRPVVLNRTTAADPDYLLSHGLRTLELIPRGLSLHLVLNRGAVFGWAQGAQFLFVGVTLIAAIALPIAVYRSRRKHWTLQIGMGLILGGALGNLYDRLCFGAVRDMLWLFPGVNLPWNLAWPNGQRGLYPWIFNIADVALLVGVGLLAIIFGRAPQRPAGQTNRG